MPDVIRILMMGAFIVALATPAFGVDCFNEIHPDYWKVDVPSLIHIKSEEDALKVRNNVIKYLWREDGFPANKMPDKVTSEAPQWMKHIGSENIERVEKLDIKMDFGLRSRVYLFHPKQIANRLLIFHMGHSDDILTAGGKETVQFFLDKGFSVMTFWMPGLGENNSPIKMPGKTPISLVEGAVQKHNQLSETLDHAKVSFIRYFLEPVVVGINYVEKKYDYQDIAMTGISGGGWTTNLCAAIEPRIRYSFPVAGSVPLYLREPPCYAASKGDAEQWWPQLYQDVASYLDLYILGGYGKGRKMVQVYNKYDNCCFFGIGYQTFEPYILEAMERLHNGSYRIYLDESHRDHKISQKVIEEVIWTDLSQEDLLSS